MNKKFRLATAQYGVERLEDFEGFENKVQGYLDTACEAGAELLLFPEYFSMELASLLDEKECDAPKYGVESLQRYLPTFIKFFQTEAQRRQIFICAGSFIVSEGGAFFNRSYCFSADGSMHYQDKLMMTRFEDEKWCISAATTIGQLWPLPWGKAGIAICYDVEFPMIAHRMVEMGAELILCPSCTDSHHGFNRVRTGCLARALENQSIVVQSVTVGDCDWSDVIDENRGAAGVYGPMDKGFPSDGVIAQGEMDVACWVYADIDFALLSEVRQNGAVLNHRDWQKQFTKN